MAHSEPRPTGRRDDNGRFSRHQAQHRSSHERVVELATAGQQPGTEPGWHDRSITPLTPQLDVPHRRFPPSGPGVTPDISPGGGEWGPDPARAVPPQVESVRADSRWFREPLTVAELMTREVKTVAPDAPVSQIAALMRDEDVGIVPVVDGEMTLQGIVTDRDIVVRGLVGGSGERELCARDLSTKEVEAVSPRDSITSVLEMMGRKQIRRAPVVGENGRLVGMVSLADLAERADYAQELQEALRQISGRRSFWSRIWR